MKRPILDAIASLVKTRRARPAVSPPILAVGPRPLPDEGTAQVWVDSGSGPGQMRTVSVARLTLADVDDGHGPCGYYLLHRPGEADRG